jgi:hypothetical protein
MNCSLRGLQMQRVLDVLVLVGIQVDRADTIMLNAYVDETISELDLMAQSHQFQTMGACHDW